METLSLSVIIPAAGRAERLDALVHACVAAASRAALDYEIIIVVGDTGLLPVATKLAANNDAVMLIKHSQPHPFGFALRDAWSVARGTYVLALNPHAPLESAAIPRLLPHIPHTVAVLGYRVPAPRGAVQRGLVAAAERILGQDIYDPALQIGLFRSDLLADLPADEDLLALAALYTSVARRGLPVAQVALPTRDRMAERVRPTTLLALLRRPPATPSTLSGPARAGLGLAALAGAVGLWILQRWRSGSRSQGQ